MENVLRKFHVHVYKVPEKGEITIMAKDKKEALSRALKLSQGGEVVFSKNDEGEFQAMGWIEGEIANKSRIEQIEAILSDYHVCHCCGCVYPDSYIRQQKCPACGEGVS